MQSSTTHLVQTPPPHPAHCVYFLPSATDSAKYKLGLTHHLPARVESLRKSYGPLDLANAVVVTANSRRAALDLEGILKRVFNAPTWRTEAATRVSKPARVPTQNGGSEWYTIDAFEAMVAFVDEMIRRDERGGINRFTLERSAPWLEAWCQQARPARKQHQWTAEELDAENKRLLVNSEANFARLQMWVKARHHQLVEVRPSPLGSALISGRVFVFQNTLDANPGITTPSDAEWQELTSMCVVSYRQSHCRTAFTYLGAMDVEETHPSKYSVELIVTEAFEQAMTFSSPMHDLLSRVNAWICQTPL